MATVGLTPSRAYMARMRQKATRMPYSCQLQLGRSGSCGAPCGGVITMRAIGRDRSQSSRDSTGHTTRRMPFGKRNGGRFSMGENARRSRGCIGYLRQISALAVIAGLGPAIHRAAYSASEKPGVRPPRIERASHSLDRGAKPRDDSYKLPPRDLLQIPEI